MSPQRLVCASLVLDRRTTSATSTLARAFWIAAIVSDKPAVEAESPATAADTSATAADTAAGADSAEGDPTA
jgi:hypothetical protein